MTLRSDPKPDCRFCHGAGIVSVSKDPDEIADCVCTDLPVRIQLSRRKGWRKPENTVVVARPGKWGNPYRIGEDSGFYGIPHTRDTAVMFFRVDLEVGDGFWSERAYGYLTVDDVRRELAGKNLACWCPLDQPCHADVLLEIANGEAR